MERDVYQAFTGVMVEGGFGHVHKQERLELIRCLYDLFIIFTYFPTTLTSDVNKITHSAVTFFTKYLIHFLILPF